MTYEPVQIAVGGATLVGDRWAGAGATIVLLHAGVCDRRSWREVGARLADAGRDVVAYDRRGFGDVAPGGAPFRHVDDLLGVLDAVSPDAPAWLVGSSMGGQVAIDAALEAPERVAGLVLLAPAISGDPELEEAVVIAATHGLAEEIDAAWTAGAVDECNRLEVRLWLDGPAEPEGRVSGPPRELALDMNRVVIAHGEYEADGASGLDGPAGPEGRVSGPPRELALDMNRIVIAHGEYEADGASGLDAASRLHEIAVPAIVACGELDVPLKLQRSAELADALANATYRSLPGRAHLPYLEAPEEIAALILDAVAPRR